MRQIEGAVICGRLREPLYAADWGSCVTKGLMGCILTLRHFMPSG